MMQIQKIYQCIRPTCRFRFHDQNDVETIQRCPKCGSPLKIKTLTKIEKENPKLIITTTNSEFHLLLDNIRSTFNVGSIFRTADGVGGVANIHICGVTPTPDHPKIAKTALGAEQTTPWTQHWNSLETTMMLEDLGYKIFAIEEHENATNLFDLKILPSKQPILLILGSETNGIDPEILDVCDQIFMIPMAGTKRSLNVSSAFSIAIYHLQHGIH